MAGIDKIAYVRACMKMMGLKEIGNNPKDFPLVCIRINNQDIIEEYNPFINAGQCLDMIEKLRLQAGWYSDGYCYCQTRGGHSIIKLPDLRNCIVQCVYQEWYREEQNRVAAAHIAGRPITTTATTI